MGNSSRIVTARHILPILLFVLSFIVPAIHVYMDGDGLLSGWQTFVIGTMFLFGQTIGSGDYTLAHFYIGILAVGNIFMVLVILGGIFNKLFDRVPVSFIKEGLLVQSFLIIACPFMLDQEFQGMSIHLGYLLWGISHIWMALILNKKTAN